MSEPALQIRPSSESASSYIPTCGTLCPLSVALPRGGSLGKVATWPMVNGRLAYFRPPGAGRYLTSC
jgi:hypothetical protein